MSVIQRIRSLVDLEKNQTVFARKVGLPQASISRLLKKESGAANYDTVMKILSAYPEINPIWFLMGEGEMHLTKTASKELHEDKDKMSDKVIKLMEKRISTLEYELKKVDPDLASQLGID